MRRSPPRVPPPVTQHYLQQRRDREDIFQDAKDTIDNSPFPMDASARFDRLAECLVAYQPSNDDRIVLVRRCIAQGWVGGFNFIISGFSAHYYSIPPCALLHEVVAQSHLHEDTQLQMVLSLITKGCSARSFRVATFSDLGKLVVFKKVESNETVLNPRVAMSCRRDVYFVQAVVQKNKSKILSSILPKLDVINFRLAVIEAFGANIKDCCDVLVDYLTANRSSEMFDFAILLASIYGHSASLEKLVIKAPDDLINTLKTKTFKALNQFSRLLRAHAPQDQTVFEATIYFNNPKCAAIWIKKVLPSQSIDVTRLLRYCADNDFGECMKVILTNWDFSSDKEWTDSILVDVLYSCLYDRRSPQLIRDLINEMKTTTGCKNCLNNLLLKCVQNEWYAGLLDLVFLRNFQDTTGSNEEITKNATLTLAILVDDGPRSETTTNIIKHLVCSLIVGEHDTNNRIDFAPIFKRLLLFNKDAELVRFFLSFHNNKSIMGAAEELRSSVNDENLKQEIDDALEEMKKMKVKEEEEVVLARVKLEQEDDG